MTYALHRPNANTIGTQLICSVIDRGSGLEGYLVVDSTINEHSMGGIRIAPDISPDSLSELARAMTLKIGVTAIGCGGAWAGIVGNPAMAPEEKRELLKAFGRALLPLLKAQYYILGADMRTSGEDIRYILKSVGIRVPRRPLQRTSLGFHTGLTVLSAATRAAEHIGIDLSHSTMAVEGFGAVGSSVARLFSEKGVKVLAVSTSQGAIYNEKGLDVDKLIELYSRVGGSMIEAYQGARHIEKSKLLEIEVDILSPCANLHSITSDNAGRVAAKLVCPGANVPTTSEAEQILFQRGILSVPYFLANCGGALVSGLKFAGADFTRNFINQRIGTEVARVIESAQKRGLPPREYAVKTAEERFLKLKSKMEARKGTLPRKVLCLAFERYQELPLPQLPLRLFYARYVKKKLSSLDDVS